MWQEQECSGQGLQHLIVDLIVHINDNYFITQRKEWCKAIQEEPIVPYARLLVQMNSALSLQTVQILNANFTPRIMHSLFPV